MDSSDRNLIQVRSIDGVLWWRFWNPMMKTGGWEYHQPDVNHAMSPEEWNNLVNGEPVRKLWTQDHNVDAQQFRMFCREKYQSEIITDIDDWYDDIPDFNPAKAVHRKHRLDLKLREMHALADTICCSTPFLVDKMGERAKLAPNFLVPESWDHPQRAPKDKDECLIFFGGGIGRASEIQAIKDALTRVMEEPNVKLMFMGAFHDFAADYPPGKAIWSRWCEVHDYPKMLRWIKPDIIISPLDHRDFNTAKSNIKWLESAMVGAAFVGERWGELERTIEDGKTGVLCDGIEEWTEALVALARDKDKRAEIAAAAKAEAMSNWTWDSVGHLWRDALGV